MVDGKIRGAAFLAVADAELDESAVGRPDAVKDELENAVFLELGEDLFLD
jgi:hypothetical protein